MVSTVYIERDDAYLIHYGVKGMKWGVRHDPERVGRRYGHTSSSNKSALSYDAQEARRNRIMRNIAIGGAVVLGTGLAIYAYQKLGREYFDNVISSGRILQTLKYNADHIDEGNAFYTAYRNGDKKKYLGGFARKSDIFGNQIPGTEKNKIQMTLNKKIKVAGYKTGRNTYDSLIANNKEFREAVGPGNLNYKEFNTSRLLNSSSPNKRKAADIFYKTLKDKGYGAVADYNDRSFSGYNTKAAIIFDKSNITKDASGKIKKNVKRVTEAEIKKGQRFFRRRYIERELLTPQNMAKYGVAGTAFVESVAYQELEPTTRNKK